MIKKILEVAENNFKAELERFENQGKMDVEGGKKEKRRRKSKK